MSWWSRVSSVVILLLLMLAVGCARQVETPKPGEEVEERNTAVVESGNYRVELTATKKQYTTKEIVPLKLTATNIGKSTVILTFPTGQRYDFAAKNEAGQEVWRWSQGRAFTMAFGELTLTPQEGRNFFDKIDAGTLKPGKYTISATVTAQELAGVTVEIKVEVV